MIDLHLAAEHHDRVLPVAVRSDRAPAAERVRLGPGSAVLCRVRHGYAMNVPTATVAVSARSSTTGRSDVLPEREIPARDLPVDAPRCGAGGTSGAAGPSGPSRSTG
jgi:hypothetical protein